VPGGPLPSQNFAWPPKNFSGLFLKALHRPLTAPLVAILAPPVAPPNENVWLHPCIYQIKKLYTKHFENMPNLNLVYIYIPYQLATLVWMGCTPCTMRGVHHYKICVGSTTTWGAHISMHGVHHYERFHKWDAPLQMCGVHHYERVHKDALQTCHTKQILFTKTLLTKMNHYYQPMVPCKRRSLVVGCGGLMTYPELQKPIICVEQCEVNGSKNNCTAKDDIDYTTVEKACFEV